MHTRKFMAEVAKICAEINFAKIEQMTEELVALRERGGRLFILGVGGSAGNASHAVNDFRKLCGIETYTPMDNVSELSARANDEGWETVFSGWLETSQLTSNDVLFVLSVGGGDISHNVSVNIIRGIELAKQRGAQTFGIVGKENGYTATEGDIVIVVPEVNSKRVTPLSEAFQAVIWHCLVCNPKLQQSATKW